MTDVVALGEPLVQFNPLDEGPLRHVAMYERHIAGSEVNVLIGLSRLGFRTSLITRLGKDEFSRAVISTLRSEEVDVGGVRRIDGRHCGVFFVQRNFPVPGRSDVIYFRGESAARTLSAEDVDPEIVSHSKMLHLSGITAALSGSCREACKRAIDLAKDSNVLVSLDTNFRRKLWTPVEAKPILSEMASRSDVLFTDPSDADILFGKKLDPAELLDRLRSLGPRTVVLKLGATQGLIGASGSERARSEPIKVPLVVDSIGAGDAVVAGFLAGFLSAEPMKRCLDMANCCAALVVTRRGDFENLPDKEYLEALLSAKELHFDVDFR